MSTIRSLVLLTAAGLFACGGTAVSSSEHPESDGSLSASSNESSASSATAVAVAVAADSRFTGVVAVLPVTDHAASVSWYTKWLGRDPDVVPAEGVAEWQLAGAAWLQVGLNPEAAGHTSVVVTVPDVSAQQKACRDLGLEVGDVQDYGVVKIITLSDPDGNQVMFVEEVQAPAG